MLCSLKALVYNTFTSNENNTIVKIHITEYNIIQLNNEIYILKDLSIHPSIYLLPIYLAVYLAIF